MGRTRTRHMSLSRCNHWLPRSQAHPEVVQGTAEFHHQIPDVLLPQPDAVFDDTTRLFLGLLNTSVSQPPLVECLVRPLLLPRELLPQIEINSYERKLQTSETLLKLAMIRLMLRRLARSPA
jgi:hypothetical protein